MTVSRPVVAVAASALLLVAGASLATERWVPVVAQVTGADGSYWNTELWIANLGGSVGTYAITFLPSAEDNGHLLLEDPATASLGPHETVHLKNVVPQGGSGALRVLLSDNLVVRCRLYNTRGGSSVGQFVPALAGSELIPSGGHGTLVPLVRSAQFRTNVGIFNPGANPIKVRATVFDEHGREVGTTSCSRSRSSGPTRTRSLSAPKVLSRLTPRSWMRGAGRPLSCCRSCASPHDSPDLCCDRHLAGLVTKPGA